MGFETALLVSAVVAAAGATFGAVQSYQTGKENARIQEQAAEAAEQKAAYDEKRHRERVRQLLSTQRALYGTAGVETAGSPLLVLEDTASQGEMDALAIRYGGDVEASRERSAARLSRKQAGSDLVSGLVGAGSTLLSGYGRYKKSQIKGK